MVKMSEARRKLGAMQGGWIICGVCSLHHKYVHYAWVLEVHIFCMYRGGWYPILESIYKYVDVSHRELPL
jgi:hypothetical protein